MYFARHIWEMCSDAKNNVLQIKYPMTAHDRMWCVSVCIV